MENKILFLTSKVHCTIIMIIIIIVCYNAGLDYSELLGSNNHGNNPLTQQVKQRLLNLELLFKHS